MGSFFCSRRKEEAVICRSHGRVSSLEVSLASVAPLQQNRIPEAFRAHLKKNGAQFFFRKANDKRFLAQKNGKCQSQSSSTRKTLKGNVGRPGLYKIE